MSLSGTGLGPDKEPLGEINRLFRLERVLELCEPEEYDLAAQWRTSWR